MARANFGGGASDFLFSRTSGGLVRLGSGTLTLWDSEAGGTRYTDLVVGGSAASEVTVGSDGQIPTFQGPDEVYEMWADAGGGRVQLEALPVDLVVAAVADAQAARSEAEAFAATAQAGAATATAPTALMVGRRVASFPLEDFLDGAAMPNDGATDAEPIIQAALVDLQAMATASAAFDTRIYVLDLPPGVIRHDESLIRNMASAGGVGINRIGVRGAGHYQTILRPTGGASAFDAHSPGSGPDDPCATKVYFGSLVIDLADATHPDPTGASYKGFKGRGWWDSKFENIDVLNSPATAIGTDFPVNCTFSNVHVRTTGSGAAGTVDANGTVDPANPITAAKSTSGFGIGFGLRDDESATFINCTAYDCYRGGFFFEAFEDDLGNDVRKAIVTMVGCSAWGNRVGLINVGAAGVTATNCDFNDNTITGYYGGVSLGTQLVASLDDTFENCRFNRNGIGAYSTGDYVLNHNYTTLRPVLGGTRFINCRIEDNAHEGVLAERFQSIEAGGLTLRGNHFRRNGRGGVRLIGAIDPVRDLIVEDNYFDGNTGAGLSLLVAMNAPKIAGNQFVNADGGTAQTHGIVLHPAEPVTAPMIADNTFRQIPTPMTHVARLDQTYITGNRVLDATTDPAVAGRLHREAFYGGTGTVWPTGSDGWLKNTAGSQINWTRGGLGITPTGGAGGRSYMYRDLGTASVYAEVTISTAVGAAATTQPLGVMLSMQGAASRTAVVAGVNGGSASFGTSDYYSVWRLVSGVATRIWESTVPQTERHTIGLARVAGSTLTRVFIDGELVHTIDVPEVAAAATLHGIIGETVSGQTRNIAEFRAAPYSLTAPPSTADTVVYGGLVDASGATYDVSGNQLATGQSIISREASTSTLTTVSGSLRLTYFTSRKTETVTQVRIPSGSTAAAATPTLVRLGIYSVAADGSLTLIGSTASDTALFSAANAAYTKALSAGVALTRGQRYAFGLLVVTGAATPTFPGSNFTGPSSEMGQGPRLTGKLDSQTDLPPTVAAGSVLETGQRFYAAVLP